MKIKLLLPVLGLTLCGIAHADYNDGLTQQQREWRNTAQFYDNWMRDIRNRGGGSSSGAVGMPDYAAQQAQSQMSWAAERERRAAQREERREELRRAQQQRAADAAASARRWEEARLQQRLDEGRKRRARIAFLEDWNEGEVRQARGLLPIEPPPVFANDQEKYEWHLNLVKNGNELKNYDPYSALVCAQMRLEGRSVARDYGRAFEFARDATICNLREAIMGTAAIEGDIAAGANRSNFNLGLDLLKAAAPWDDGSGGQELAYRQLYRVFFDPTFFFDGPIPLDLEWRINTLTYFINTDSEQKTRSTRQLIELLNDNQAALPEVLAKMKIFGLLDALTPEVREQCAPQVQFALAQVMKKASYQEYPLFYLPVVKRMDSTSALDDEICLRLYHYTMTHNDPIAEKLVEHMSPRLRERALRFVQDASVREPSTLDSDIRSMVLDYYIGSLGEAPQAEKAKAWGRQMAENGEGEALVRIAAALRAGRPGWQQSDAAAEAFCERAATRLKDEEKAGALLTMGYMFGPQPEIKVPENRPLRLKYLEAAYTQSGGKLGRLALAQALAEDANQKTRVLGLLDEEIAFLQETIRLAESVEMPTLVAIAKKKLQEPQTLREKVAAM